MNYLSQLHLKVRSKMKNEKLAVERKDIRFLLEKKHKRVGYIDIIHQEDKAVAVEFVAYENGHGIKHKAQIGYDGGNLVLLEVVNT